MKKVLCIGELLIDFYTTKLEMSLGEAQYFEKQAGGAPANVSAAIAKLGGASYFCGKVGDDAFGHYLQQTLQQVGVNTAHLIFDKNSPTTLAFVSRQADGERDFIFIRGADELLAIDDIDVQSLVEVEMIHFGSATALLSEPFYRTYGQLLHTFSLQGSFISFDPNFRADLWKGRTEEFIEKCMPFLQTAHFVKMSAEELLLLSRCEQLEEAYSWLQQYRDKAFAITCGAKGTIFVRGGERHLIASITVQSIDSTGAGDAFVGAVLYQLSLHPNPTETTSTQYKKMIEFANRVGAKVCEKVGAIEALPTIQELEE